jgi:hypothetical protein
MADPAVDVSRFGAVRTAFDPDIGSACLGRNILALGRLILHHRPALALTGDVNAGCAPAFLRNGKERAMIERRRFNQQLPLQDRLESFAKTARELAALLPPGAEKDELLRKAQRADTVAGLNKSFESTAQQPLKASR